MAHLPAGEDFGAFYERHYADVYRVCRAYMKNTFDAEDCTEDTFVRALTAAPDFESTEHQRAWLLVTAMNLCRDRLKHWWRKKVVALAEQPALPQAPEPETNEVLRAVLALPPKYKDVILLYYYGGYSTDQVAALLRRPPSTVRNQLRDARKRLRIQIGGEEP